MSDKQYWFPAKRYGWGWGLPTTWQGWVVYGVYFVLLLVGLLVVPPAQSEIGFIAYVVALSAALCALCYAKGEPPKWRWGRRRTASGCSRLGTPVPTRTSQSGGDSTDIGSDHLLPLCANLGLDFYLDAV